MSEKPSASASGKTRRRARGRAGLTLIELLLVVAIIGVIAAILIPNFLDSVQKARQKRTMAEMHETGKAMTTWFLDRVSGAAAGATAPPFDISEFGSPVDPDMVESLLVPVYISHLERKDSWGHAFEYYLQTDNLYSANVMAIRSPGDDGNFETSYSPGPFTTTDYSEDIVWANGSFIHWPQN